MADVLIVGAGPTGLTLAIALVQQGLSVRIVETLQERMRQSRALALQSRTLEILEKMGVLPPFLCAGKPLKGAHFYLQGKSLLEIDVSALDIPYPFVLSIPQDATEALLEEALLRLGVAVEKGVSLKRLENTRAVLGKGDGKEEEVKTRWICGCDGAHSTLRHLLGMPFQGAPFEEQFFLAEFAISAGLEEDQASVFLRMKELVAFVPLPKPFWYRVIVGSKEKKAQHEIEELLHKMELPIQERGWSSSFSIHRRIVSYMQKDNCFLLGDAAHIHSPVGGQGLNTGVQDAYNLAWKLGLVHKGLAKEELLKSFHQERYPIAKAVLRYTTRATHFILSPRFVRRYLRLFVFLLKKLHMQKKVAEGISEIALTYYKSPIIDYTPIPGILAGPGERAPDVLLPDGSRLFTHLCHPLHTLLLFGEHEEVKEWIKGHYAQGIAIVQLPFILAYCTKVPSFYLVRPDGYIAFCGMEGDKGRLKAYLERIFL